MLSTFPHIVHTLLIVFVCSLYAKAAFLLIKTFSVSQEQSGGFFLIGWLSLFSDRDVDIRPYVLRLSLLAAVVMFILNIWHLFTYLNEDIPDVKNIAWRVAHVLVGALLIFIARGFIQSAERRRNDVSP